MQLNSFFFFLLELLVNRHFSRFLNAVILVLGSICSIDFKTIEKKMKVKSNWPASEFTFSETELLAGLTISNTTTTFSQSFQFIALNSLETPCAVANSVGANWFSPASWNTLRPQCWVALAWWANTESSSSVGDGLDRLSWSYCDAETILLDVQSKDGKLRSGQSTCLKTNRNLNF